MDDLVKKIDAKLLTAAGGIVIALALTIVVYQITVKRVDAIAGEINRHNTEERDEAQRLNETMIDLRKAINEQSQATRDLQGYIRQNR